MFLIYKNVSFENSSYKAVYKLNYRWIFKGNNCYEQKPDKRFNPYRLMLPINCLPDEQLENHSHKTYLHQPYNIQM